jgi:hypothetical protein
MKTRWRCEECNWIGLEGEIDVVRDPKPESGVHWSICPQCRAAEQFINLCDEPGCKEASTSGWPSPDGYRRTCWQHGKHNFME